MRPGIPVDYFASHERHSSRFAYGGPYRPRSASVPNHWRRQATLVIALGLLTFFFPLVTTDSSVAGITHWSSFDMVQQAYRGNLPAYRCERTCC
jgi:hypothetical protein